MFSDFARRLSSLPARHQYLLVLMACAATTVIACLLAARLDLANILMLFLFMVLVVAITLGLAPMLLAALLGVAAFQVFLAPPHFWLQAHDAQDLVTLAVMLAAALIAGRLAAGLRRQAAESAREAERARALCAMARDLSGALALEQVVDITRRFLRQVLHAEAVLLLGGSATSLQPQSDREEDIAGRLRVDTQLAAQAFTSGQPVGSTSPTVGGQAALFLPLLAPMRVRGVLAVTACGGDADRLLAQRQWLETMASLVAIAIERVHYVDVAQRTQVQMVAERLRSSILSALSHDLRTPLTALVGLADSLVGALAVNRPPPAQSARVKMSEAALAIRDQAEHMASLVGNLLEMARLHAGDVTLQKEWQPIEEVIGTSIKLLGRALAEHPVRVTLAPDLPLVEFDAVLVERVFCNLLENAAKYSSAGAAIDIQVTAAAGGEPGVVGMLRISVGDRGCGFVGVPEPALFEMFVRGDPESSTPGVGLGLAICQAIVEAHGGGIHAENRVGGGASVTFTLPLGDPPTIEEEWRMLEATAAPPPMGVVS